jgi:hypothetical protein
MKSILRTAVAGLAVAALGVSSPAWAASATADAHAEILDSLTLTMVTNLLDFGLIADNGAGGTVDVTPGSSTPTCNGGLVCSGGGASPSFTLEGEPNLRVGISFPDPTPQLSDGTNTMDYALASSAASLFLDGSGDGAFTVGGTLTVAANQPAGVYTGQFDVVAVYN